MDNISGRWSQEEWKCSHYTREHRDKKYKISCEYLWEIRESIANPVASKPLAWYDYTLFWLVTQGGTNTSKNDFSTKMHFAFTDIILYLFSRETVVGPLVWNSWFDSECNAAPGDRWIARKCLRSKHIYTVFKLLIPCSLINLVLLYQTNSVHMEHTHMYGLWSIQHFGTNIPFSGSLYTKF